MEKLKTHRFDILTKKHWQLVLVLYASAFLLDLVGTYATYYWRFWWVDAPFTMLIGVLYFSYPILTWKRLSELLAGQPLFERTNRRKILAALFIVVFAPLLAALFPYESPRFVLAPLYLFCFAFISSLPAKQLKSIDLKRNAGIWEYVPEAFQFFLWPLGAFWLQPRINDLLKKRIIIRE